MRITILFPEADMGGGARVVATYAERLTKRGHDVRVVSVPPRPVSLRNALQRIRRGDISFLRRRRGESHLSPLGLRHKVLERWRPIIDSDVPDADVVIATWWETAEWANRLCGRKGSKVYLVQGHEVFPYLPVDRVRATYKLPLRKVAVSQWLAEVMRVHYGDTDVMVVPNAVDSQHFNAPPRMRQPVFTVGLVVSESACKNSVMGFRAVELARAHLPDLRLICFGSKPDWPGAGQDWVECRVRPTQDVIRDCYARCDAWLFTSTEEGFGLPILEAMACRTPVIATPAGAAPQLLAGGGGVLLSEADPQAMAKAIVDVAQMSDAAWRQMSDLATATATAYTWDDATDLLEAALERAVRANRGNPGDPGESDAHSGLSSAVEVEK